MKGYRKVKFIPALSIFYLPDRKPKKNGLKKAIEAYKVLKT
jgi:hypothetical protein